MAIAMLSRSTGLTSDTNSGLPRRIVVVPRQRHGDLRVRFGRERLLRLGAGVFDLGQQTPGIRVVLLELSAATAEIVEDESKYGLIEIGARRMIGSSLSPRTRMLAGIFSITVTSHDPPPRS